MTANPTTRAMRRQALVWLAFLVLAWPAGGRAQELGQAERDGYRQWLHSLEQAVAGRSRFGKEERLPLFPLGQTVREEENLPAYRHLSISRAVSRMERAAPGEVVGRRGAFGALAKARNYLNLTEYDSSLVWYQRASFADTQEAYAEDICRERLAAAVVLNDSLRIVHSLVNTVGTSDLAGREAEVVIAYRYLLGRRDEKNLALLVQKLDQRQEQMSIRLRYWHALALAGLESWQQSLIQLRRLVREGSLSGGLSESQRQWVLTAMPDLLCLLGRRQEARELYEILATSSLRPLQLWGEYQAASVDFASGRFLRAQVAFARVCESGDAGPWRSKACEMAGLAETLHRIRREGESYGAAAFYER